MIIGAFLNLIYTVVLIIVSPFLLLPNVTVDSGFANFIAQAGESVRLLNNIFLVNDILSTLYGILIIEALIISFKLVMWLVRRLPTQS